MSLVPMTRINFLWEGKRGIHSSLPFIIIINFIGGGRRRDCILSTSAILPWRIYSLLPAGHTEPVGVLLFWQGPCNCKKEAIYKSTYQLLQVWVRSVVSHLHLSLNQFNLIWAFRCAESPIISAVGAGVIRYYCSTKHSRIVGLLVLQLRVL